MLKSVSKKIKRLFVSCCEIGLYQTWLIIKHRFKRAVFIKRMGNRALRHKAQHQWNQLSKSWHKSWNEIDNNLCKQQLPYVQKLFTLVDSSHLMSDANKYAHNLFHALGSSWYQLDETMWHTDIRLKQHGVDDVAFSSTAFYDDIEIIVGQDDQIKKDIKVPWELSRLQHLPLLGYMYQVTGDLKYKDAFVMHVQHWKQHNSYLLGVNWLCPMEVGLRSISLVIASDFFKNADIDPLFWQSYAALLYDHMVYLEHNWEWYDGKTSNHYLSDLVGYLYLCFYFQSFWDISRKRDWVIKELVSEMEKQIFKEGTSYEGSTRYHVLVTELFYHVEQLAEQMQIKLPRSFHETLSRMFEFMYWCSIDHEYMITIGDDDSGKVTYVGLLYEVVFRGKKSTGIKHYNQFGLSIIKDDRWHVSLRHHAYDNKQPSGHHHNDVGSITLALKGVPVLIDPGSYLYTPSKVIRNQFRSASVHNGIHIMGQEPMPFDDRLFGLAIPPNHIDLSNSHKKMLHTSHRLFEQYYIKYDRTIELYKNALFIYDNVHNLDTTNEDISLFFNFIFGDTIILKKESDWWIGFYENRPFFKLQSSFDLQKIEGRISPNYGVSKQTTCLTACLPLMDDKEYVTTFFLV